MFSLKNLARKGLNQQDQVMAQNWTGNKPLPEPMMSQFIEIYMCHLKKFLTLYVLNFSEGA